MVVVAEGPKKPRMSEKWCLRGHVNEFISQGM